MRKVAIVSATMLAMLGLVAASCQSAPENASVPQPITLENAGRVTLLRTMEIPGYRRGQISQCSLAFSPDGGLLVGACGRNQVPVWDARSGEVLHLLYDGSQQMVACAFDPTGTLIAAGGFDERITLWNAQTGEKIGELGPHGSPVWDLDFSPDGKELVSCGLGDDIRLWDLGSRGSLWARADEKAYLSVDFAPSGSAVAFGGRWGDAGVLNSANGERETELLDLGRPVGDIAYSPSGRLLAAGTDGNMIYLWTGDGYQSVATMVGHHGYVNGVSFSPDETLLASGSHDRTVGLWDVASQRLLTTLSGHNDVVLRVAFSPDGSTLASISWDGTVRLWAAPGE